MFNTPFIFFKNKEVFGPRLFYLGPYTSFNGDTNIKGIYTSTYDSLSTPAPYFNSGTGFSGGPYWGFVDSKGRILLGGFFTSYQGVSANRIIRLTPKGSIDTTFQYGTGFNADVRWVAEDSNGKIYVAGNFTTYQGVSANRMIRLNNDGSVDTSFSSPSFNALVTSGVLVDDNPIVVGYFTSPKNGIVKLTQTGAVDSSFNVGTGFSPSGNTVFQIKKDSSDNVFVVGRFTSYNGSSSPAIVKILPDGSRDTSFVVGTGFPTTAGMYTCTIQSDGKVVVGGFQTSYKGTSINKLVRIMPNGSIDNSLTTYPLNTTDTSTGIRSVVEDASGNLYIGGIFTTYGGLSYPNFVKIDNSGSIDTSYLDGTSQFNNTIWHTVPYNTTV